MDTVAANRYAVALLNLAKDSGSEDSVRGDLEFLDKVFVTSGLGKFLESPEYTLTSKRRVIDQIADKLASQVMANFIHLLLRKNRTSLLPQIRESYYQLYKKAKGVTSCEVVLADEPSAGLKKDISSRLKKITGGSIEMLIRRDPSIIGGVEIKIENRMIDASYRRSLIEIRRSLLEKSII